MDKDNIVLIGMPASGKSTVGVILAKLLGFDFIDADLLIQRREGRLLSEIIRDEGLDGFLAIENDVCRGIEASRTVIATGGSAVYGSQAMRHLAEIGWIVYLEAGFESIQSRLSDIRGRGVVLREGQTLESLYRERVPLYRKYAEITVPEAGLGIEATVEAVRRALDGRV
ncbi:MAG: shikimate kinase [Clostridiales bacterium]|nr:shikimate kinase [Clostridiales bacterium]